MVGDGVESGYLSPYLVGARALADHGCVGVHDLWRRGRCGGVALGCAVGCVGTAPCDYARAGAVAGLRGAVPDGGVALRGSLWLVLLTYGLRGLGYPLFAFGFSGVDHGRCTQAPPGIGHGMVLVCVYRRSANAGLRCGELLCAAHRRLQHAVGFDRAGARWAGWCFCSAFASCVVRGGSCRRRRRPIRALLGSIAIAWQKPKTGIACLVRVINTAPEFGFFIFLPTFFTSVVGFTMTAWLRLLSAIFLSNIIWNLLFGLDR